MKWLVILGFSLCAIFASGCATTVAGPDGGVISVGPPSEGGIIVDPPGPAGVQID